MKTRRLALSLLVLLSPSAASAHDEGEVRLPEAPAPDATAAPAPRATPVPDAAGAASATPATPAPADTAPDVTVAGTKVSRTAGSAHVISSKKLERFEYDDPAAVLTSVPGVYARGEDGVGLRPNIGLRGVNPDRSKKVALLEDGIPFAPAPYSASAAYYFPLITRMSSVRVIKGPAAIVYGPQTIGGAVDLVTRSIPATTSGMVDLAAGEYGYGKMHAYAGSSTEKVGFLIEGVHLRNDGFKNLPNGQDTGFYRNEWMFKGNYLVDPQASVRNELKVKLTYSDEVSNETYLGLSDSDFRADPLRRYAASKLDRMKWSRVAIALTHVLTPAPNLSITTTAYRSDLTRQWRKVNHFRGAELFDVLRDPTNPRNAVYAGILNGTADSSSSGETLLVGPNQRDFVSQGIETRVRWNPKTGPIAHRIEYGLRVHHDRIERRHSEDGFKIIGGELIPEGTPTVVTALNEASTEALAIHALDAMTWKELTVTPGLRVEAIRSTYIDRTTNVPDNRLAQVFLPGVGAFYSLTKSLGVLGGVYRGFGPVAPGSAPGVKPELSINYEGGARFVRGPMRVEVIGFYNNYSNLTDTCTLSSGCSDANLDRQFDAGKARIYGLEAFAEHDVKVGPINVPINASYTLTRSEFLRAFKSDDPIFGDVHAGDELPYIPRHQLNASVGVEHKRAGGALGMSYVSAMREIAGAGPISQTLATDEQLLFDVSGNFRVLDNVVLYANVRNLLNEHYLVGRRPFGARPNAPRWIQVGAKVTF